MSNSLHRTEYYRDLANGIGASQQMTHQPKLEVLSYMVKNYSTLAEAVKLKTTQ